MVNIILKLLLIIFVLLGVVSIYDARIITKKFFSFGDQNEGSLGLKLIGFFVVIVSSVILYFICK